MRLSARIRSIIVLFIALFLGVMFMAAECRCEGGQCTITNDDGGACVYIPDGRGSDVTCGGRGGGGGGGSAATPTAVATATNTPGPSPTASATAAATPTSPAVSRTWLLLPGCCGRYSAWYEPTPTFSDSNGNPDHHDFAPTQHSVDIGAGSCTSCPDVIYYDQSHSVTAFLTHFDVSCGGGRGGGERVEIRLSSLDPAGVFQGVVAYLHLTKAAQTGSTVVDGTFLGTINPSASSFQQCWTDPHLHQGIDSTGSSAALTHYTGVYGSGANCEGFPYPESTPWDPVVPNQQARSNVPCYSLSW